MSTPKENRSPSELVAIARAAHIVGDRDLERAARNGLLAAFGIELRFADRKRKRPEAAPCS